MKQYRRQVRDLHLKQDCRYPLKCFKRVTQERRENVLEGFLGAWRLDCIECLRMCKCENHVCKAKVCKKGETSLHSRRNYFRQYYINDNRVPTRV